MAMVKFVADQRRLEARAAAMIRHETTGKEQHRSGTKEALDLLHGEHLMLRFFHDGATDELFLVLRKLDLARSAAESAESVLHASSTGGTPGAEDLASLKANINTILGTHSGAALAAVIGDNLPCCYPDCANPAESADDRANHVIRNDIHKWNGNELAMLPAVMTPAHTEMLAALHARKVRLLVDAWHQPGNNSPAPAQLLKGVAVAFIALVCDALFSGARGRCM